MGCYFHLFLCCSDMWGNFSWQDYQEKFLQNLDTLSRFSIISSLTGNTTFCDLLFTFLQEGEGMQILSFKNRPLFRRQTKTIFKIFAILPMPLPSTPPLSFLYPFPFKQALYDMQHEKMAIISYQTMPTGPFSMLHIIYCYT